MPSPPPTKRKLCSDGAIEDLLAEEPPLKRKKYENRPEAREVVDEMELLMDTINRFLLPEYALSPVISRIPQDLLKRGVAAETVSAELETFKNACQIRFRQISIRRSMEPPSNLTPAQSLEEKKLQYGLNEGANAYPELILKAEELRDALFFKPPPSGYQDNLATLQDLPGAILCFRPTYRHGLPLTLLHPVFSRFRHLSRQPLPNSAEAVEAMRVALRLCGSMGDIFENENARSDAFDKAMSGFLPGVDGARNLRGSQVKGEAGRVYRVGGTLWAIREDKADTGKGGDAFIQGARDFDMACEKMELNGITPDTPIFLLSVMGPTLTIAGGFKDGAATVVEPLSQTLFMFKDFDDGDGRAVQLATHLFSLRACIESLPLPPAPSQIPGMPRVFPDHGLTFQRQLEADKLMFSAVDNTSRQLCVKFVYGRYGQQVHEMLSQNKMAPQLFDVTRIDGGPTMIVMEMLDTSWQTLFDFAQKEARWKDPSVQLAISKRLGEIVTKLEEGGFVHGDFRANNIMIKPGEEESAVVIDFDWAGEDGEVHYPLYRNRAGIQWPAEVASAIRLNHDRTMLGTQWAELLQGQ